MIDPVREELASRARAGWPWRRAVLIALAVHAGVGVALVLGGSARSRPLSLPSVQVRLTSLPLPAAKPQGSAAKPAAGAPSPAKPREIAKPNARTEPEKRPSVADTTTRKQKAKPPRPSERTTAERAPGSLAPVPATPVAPGGTGAASATSQGSPQHGLTLGGSSEPATEEAFPYAYYLNRLLGMIESNWFRPPVPPDTRCRVRCRIDRSGRLLEAGIEEPSGIPAFDRAALRAVYASAPYPPLPQGFGGATLTLHLEFGQ